MKPFTKIASFILAVVALGHLARVFLDALVVVGNYELPIWVSVAGFIVASILSIGLWRESK